MNTTGQGANPGCSRPSCSSSYSNAAARERSHRSATVGPTHAASRLKLRKQTAEARSWESVDIWYFAMVDPAYNLFCKQHNLSGTASRSCYLSLSLAGARPSPSCSRLSKILQFHALRIPVSRFDQLRSHIRVDFCKTTIPCTRSDRECEMLAWINTFGHLLRTIKDTWTLSLVD